MNHPQCPRASKMVPSYVTLRQLVQVPRPPSALMTTTSRGPVVAPPVTVTETSSLPGVATGWSTVTVTPVPLTTTRAALAKPLPLTLALVPVDARPNDDGVVLVGLGLSVTVKQLVQLTAVLSGFVTVTPLEPSAAVGEIATVATSWPGAGTLTALTLTPPLTKRTLLPAVMPAPYSLICWPSAPRPRTLGVKHRVWG